MIDVFISYSSKDRERAAAIAEGISAQGMSVWWDLDLLAGEQFAKSIETVIRQARAAIVVWSENSIASRWVLEEVELARKLDILLAVKIDAIEIPFGHAMIHTEDLKDWNGDPLAPKFQKLLHALAQKTGRALDERTKEVSAQKPASYYREESEYWSTIANANPQSSEEYEAYLTRFGESATFSDLARLRIAQLGVSRSPPKRIYAASMKGVLGSAAALATVAVGIVTVQQALQGQASSEKSVKTAEPPLDLRGQEADKNETREEVPVGMPSELHYAVPSESDQRIFVDIEPMVEPPKESVVPVSEFLEGAGTPASTPFPNADSTKQAEIPENSGPGFSWKASDEEIKFMELDLARRNASGEGVEYPESYPSRARIIRNTRLRTEPGRTASMKAETLGNRDLVQLLAVDQFGYWFKVNWEGEEGYLPIYELGIIQ